MSGDFDYLPKRVQKKLCNDIKTIMQPGKGILSADEVENVMGRRFQHIGVQNTENNRRRYRQLLFTTDPKISKDISAIILVNESIYQKTDDGVPFLNLLKERNIVVGILVSMKKVALRRSENEFTAEGLDDLDERIEQYKKEGCVFAKWSCEYRIEVNTPSARAINTNAHTFARFASICQAQQMVPMIETDILTEGDHDLDRCQKVTETAFSAIIKALNDYHVYLEGILLQVHMITPGQKCDKRYIPLEIANATVLTLRRIIPPAVGGIAFISSGQAEEQASVNLNEIMRSTLAKPWPMTFAFGRALQTSVLRSWGGKKENVCAGQIEFLKRARANTLACCGEYEPGLIPTFAGEETPFVDETRYSRKYSLF